MSLLLAEGIVKNAKDMKNPADLATLIECGETLLFPGESIDVTKEPIELPDSTLALKSLFLYKVKRKKEESDDEEEKKPEESESEADDDEEDEEEEEEDVDNGDESS